MQGQVGRRIGGVSEIAVLAPIRRGAVKGERRTHEERLRSTIANLDSRHSQGLPTELSRIPAIHFGRLIILEMNTESTTEKRPYLLTLVEFDGDIRVYMRDIALFLNSDFDNIFRDCEDYPGAGNFDEFWSWVERHQIATHLFYAAYPNLSVVRLKYLEAFKRKFDAFLARVRGPNGARLAAIDDLFDDFLRDSLQRPSNFPTGAGVYLTSGREEPR